MAEKSRIIVVCGPTATGKTELAVELAVRLGGEVVNADSMQVYAGLPIGTAAPTATQRARVAFHLAGTVPARQPYSVADWLAAARAAIDDIAARGALPVVCGGTGLYIKCLLRGTAFAPEADDGALAALLAEWDKVGGEAMLQRLARLDPWRADMLHANDKKRILRALAQHRRTGQPSALREAAQNAAGPVYNALCLGLNLPRAALYAAVNARVDRMMAAGLADEARMVWQFRRYYKTAAQAIGYKELFPYFEGTAELACCVDKLKQATRNYSKRQLTWFRGMPELCWLDAAAPGLYNEAMERAVLFLDGKNCSMAEYT